jgi:hypothetical protein
MEWGWWCGKCEENNLYGKWWKSLWMIGDGIKENMKWIFCVVKIEKLNEW